MSIASEREAQLAAEGWNRQTMTNEPRLSEIIKEYQDLGFEVLVEPINPEACESSSQCTSCFDDPQFAEQFKIVFTRPGIQSH